MHTSCQATHHLHQGSALSSIWDSCFYLLVYSTTPVSGLHYNKTSLTMSYCRIFTKPPSLKWIESTNCSRLRDTLPLQLESARIPQEDYDFAVKNNMCVRFAQGRCKDVCPQNRIHENISDVRTRSKIQNPSSSPSGVSTSDKIKKEKD